MWLVTVNWSKVPAALSRLPNWKGRVVIDANNPILAPLFKPVDLHDRSLAWCRRGRVVKAFNHLLPPLLAGDPRAEADAACCPIRRHPCEGRGRALIDQLGFFGIDLAALAVGDVSCSLRAGRHIPVTTLWAHYQGANVDAGLAELGSLPKR
jgi:8-hydroxy-5-deazaflavin:NADPH oxidoreductase